VVIAENIITIGKGKEILLIKRIKTKTTSLRDVVFVSLYSSIHKVSKLITIEYILA